MFFVHLFCGVVIPDIVVGVFHSKPNHLKIYLQIDFLTKKLDLKDTAEINVEISFGVWFSC